MKKVLFSVIAMAMFGHGNPVFATSITDFTISEFVVGYGGSKAIMFKDNKGIAYLTCANKYFYLKEDHVSYKELYAMFLMSMALNKSLNCEYDDTESKCPIYYCTFD